MKRLLAAATVVALGAFGIAVTMPGSEEDEEELEDPGDGNGGSGEEHTTDELRGLIGRVETLAEELGRAEEIRDEIAAARRQFSQDAEAAVDRLERRVEELEAQAGGGDETQDGEPENPDEGEAEDD